MNENKLNTLDRFDRSNLIAMISRKTAIDLLYAPNGEQLFKDWTRVAVQIKGGFKVDDDALLDAARGIAMGDIKTDSETATCAKVIKINRGRPVDAKEVA